MKKKWCLHNCNCRAKGWQHPPPPPTPVALTNQAHNVLVVHLLHHFCLSDQLRLHTSKSTSCTKTCACGVLHQTTEQKRERGTGQMCVSLLYFFNGIMCQLSKSYNEWAVLNLTIQWYCKMCEKGTCTEIPFFLAGDGGGGLRWAGIPIIFRSQWEHSGNQRDQLYPYHQFILY